MNETTTPSKFPSFTPFFWASLLLGLFGWGGLAILVSTTVPTMGPRWLFYFLMMCAVSGLGLPITYFVNRRFLTKPPADGNVIVREAIWIGGYVCVVAWLQQGTIFTPVLSIALALGFAIMEILLRIRELSLWKPKETTDE